MMFLIRNETHTDMHRHTKWGIVNFIIDQFQILYVPDRAL